MNNPANDYYPKDLYQTEKKEASPSPKPFDMQKIFSMLNLQNPLLASIFKGQSIDQKSLIQAFSSVLNQNEHPSSQQKTIDNDFCEEL